MLDVDEDWDWVKMGRYSDADEHMVRRVMGPWFLRGAQGRSARNTPKSPKSLGQEQKNFRMNEISGRANVVSLGHNYRPGRQAVITLGDRPKSQHGVQSQICYVARLRDEDRENEDFASVSLWDCFGMPITSEVALNISQSWDLKGDEENYAPKARLLLEQGKSRAFYELSERKRLHFVQSWHFIFSIEEDGLDEAMEKQFHAAVRASIDETFTVRGHKVLWTIHKGHTGHLHAHAIVKALSELGGRIHSDVQGRYLLGLRTVFARNLKLTGLEYEASLRVDRGPMRERIQAGFTPLNDQPMPWRKGDLKPDPYANLKMWQGFCGRRALDGLEQLDMVRSAVGEATKNVSGKHRISLAAHVLREKLAEAREKNTWLERNSWKFPWSNRQTKLPVDYSELHETFNRMYHNPEQALVSWQHMSMDGAWREMDGNAVYPNRSLASWTLRNRPELFGAVRAGAFELSDDKLLKKRMRQARLPSPERVPFVEDADNTFQNIRNLIRIQKDRRKIMAELKRLLCRVVTEHNNPWWEEGINAAIRQTKRIDIGQRLAENRPTSKMPFMPQPLSSVRVTSEEQLENAMDIPSPDNQNTQVVDSQKNTVLPSTVGRRSQNTWGR